MLSITIKFPEEYDEANSRFIPPLRPPITLKLEHSLVSISKWESKWCKPYMSKKQKTTEEVIDYIRCMTLTQNVDPNVYRYLTDDHITAIAKYIESPMTATRIRDNKKNKINNEQITSELIYYWMISLNIPWECRKWHINRLLTLIKVCTIKNAPPKKRSAHEIQTEYAALNKARREELKTKG